MKYDAFISYRHTPLDMEVAKKLHKTLETYHIPRSVQKKTGKKRINRVFRDQEELPIGSDLNDNISGALKESEYLIVICSPNTPESYWVLKEIESFIELHDREHILAILIDGEPNESFPAPLLTDEKGNPVEPLAADIRGKTPKERDKKFKTEFLRLAAPLIGCTYDDLKQRHKERIIKRNITIGAAALAAVAAFGLFFGTYNAVTAAKMKKLAEEKAALAEEKTRLAGEIYTEFQSKQINQSKFYAEKSLSLLDAGRREDAVLVALEGLPTEENDRPYVSEAEYALSRALYTYGSDTNYQYNKELRTDYSLYELVLNDTETRVIATTSTGIVYVWDTNTWEELIRVDPIRMEKSVYTVNGINADEQYIYISTPGYLLYVDYEGNVVKNIPFEETIQNAEINIKSQTAVLNSLKTVYEFDLKTATILHEFKNSFEDTYGYQVEYVPEQHLIAVNHNQDDENSDSYVSLFDTETESVKKLPAKGNSIAEIHYTSSGKISFLSRKSEHIFASATNDCINTYSVDGTFLWRTYLETDYQPLSASYQFLSSHTIQLDEGEVSRLLVSLQTHSFTLDENTGALIAQATHPSVVTGCHLFGRNSTAYLSFGNGDIIPLNTENGQFYSQFAIHSTDAISYMMACVDKDAMLILKNSSTGVFVMTTMKGADLEKVFELPTGTSYIGAPPSGDYFIFSDSDNCYYYDNDGKQIFTQEKGDFVGNLRNKNFWNNCFVADYSGDLVICDPIAKEVKQISFSDLGIEGNNAQFTINEATSTAAILDSYRNVYILDLKELKITNSYKIDEQISRFLLSPDGKTLIVECLFSLTLKAFDAETGKEKNLPITMTLQDHMSYTNDIFKFSNDGKYFVYLSSDQTVVVVNTSDYSVVESIPLSCSTNCFMQFIGEDVLLLQGSDYKIYCYDVSKNELLNSTGFAASIYRVRPDSERELTVIEAQDCLYVLNNKDYGVLAYVPGGFTYSAPTGCFLVSDRLRISKIPYKNYRELIAEAKKQFPDSELTDKKRVEYNID